MKDSKLKTARQFVGAALLGMLVLAGCGGGSDFAAPATVVADSCPGVSDEVALNGTNQYIDMGSIRALSGDMTIEAWIYAEAANNWSRIVDMGVNPTGNSVQDNIYLGFYGLTGQINLETKVSQAAGANQFVTTATLPLNTWVHVAGVIKGDGSAKIYFDGVEKASSFLLGSQHTVNSVTRASNYIGRSNYTADSYFKGKVRSVRIWDEARSQDQISAGMNSPLTATDLSNPNRVCYTPTNKP